MRNNLHNWKRYSSLKDCWLNYKLKLPVLILVFCCNLYSPVFAQHIISGKITSDAGAALENVTVQAKGGGASALTDANGLFKINVSADATLIFSLVGFTTRELPVANKTRMDVQLIPEIQSLGEVVVIGYGTQKKEDLTGAISSVKAKDLKNQSVTNIQTAIVGKIPGVYAATTSGQPGSGAMIRIRGVGTVNANGPLYVVDGQFLDDINNINPNDVERLDVLKDASATAIYGSRGANGVIVITTKKGLSGKTIVNLDAYIGSSSSTFTPKIANSTQLYNFLKESYDNDGLAFPAGIQKLYDRGVNTDWWDVTTRDGLTQNYNLSIRGGSEKLKSALSLGYVKEDGFIKTTTFNRFTAHWNSEYKLSSRITLGSNVNLIQSKQRNMDAFSEPIWQIISADPFSYVYNPLVNESDLNYTYNKYAPTEWAFTDNPLFLLESNNAATRKFNVLGNAYANVKLLEGLTYNVQFSFDKPTANGNSFVPSFNAKPSDINFGRLKFRNNNVVSASNSTALNTIWQQTLNYNKAFGKHNITALVGMTYENNYFESISGSKTNTPSNDPSYWVIDAGSASPNVNGSISENSILSYLGRINYAFSDRYLATVSFRADGSSRFASDNRWGYFPSFSVGWRLSNEPFFKKLNIQAISDLKIRAGWGQTGNQTIDNSAAITTIGSANYQVYTFGGVNYPAYGPRNLGNSNIKWETSEQTNIGLEAALFDSKFSLTADYYVKNTNNMLLRLPVPAYTGFPNSPFTNAGSVQNKGFEVAVNWQDKKGDFSYAFGANASIYRNKVTSLGEGDNPIYGNGFKSGLTKTEVGQPIGRFYGYKWLGIFQNQAEVDAYKNKDGQLIAPLAKPGDFKFADTDGNGVLNDNDRTYIGSPHPDLIFGFNLNLGYKNFDLAASFFGTLGNDLWNENLSKYFVSIDNVPADAYTKAWRQEGDNTRFPRITQTNKNNNNRSSSWYVEDGSFLRLKNVQLGYTLPKTIFKNNTLFNSCRFYVSGQNLLTFTKYSGMDPEVGNNNPLQLGFEITRYPASRIISFGVNAEF